jgi:hypothetical protein
LMNYASDDTAFCLAIVYNMLGYFNIDRSRIYVGGFSLGGQDTDAIAHMKPWLFRSYLLIGMSAGLDIPDPIDNGWYRDPSLYYCRHHATIVLADGDYDYNRLSSYHAYDTLISLGTGMSTSFKIPCMGIG